MSFFDVNKHNVIITILLVMFCVQSIRSINEKSATFDEVQNYGMGKYLLLNQKWDVMGAIMHPPLSFYISSLPLLFFEEDKGLWDYGDTNKDLTFLAAVDAYRGQELLSSSLNSNDRLLILSRMMILLTSLALGYYIYRFSSDLYGRESGILSLILFAFCPNMLAYSGIITPDMPLTVFSFISIYYFREFLKNQNIISTLLAGVSLGLALSTKFTALLLIPFVLLVYVVYLIKEKQKVTCNIFILIGSAVIVFLVSYGFNIVPFIQGNEHRLTQMGVGFSSFLNGKYSVHGWWYYYLVVFLLKTPVPILVLFSIALIYCWKYRSDIWFEALFLLLPIVALFTVFSSSNIAAGVRYLLPIYPCIFVLIGGVWHFANNLRYLVYIMVIWYVVASLFIAPHYLSYFNEIIGGPDKGYKYLVDSNLDWGQDLKGLKKYMDDHAIKRISLSYFGIDSPKRYGIEYDWLPSHHLYNPRPENEKKFPVNRFLAISATNLQGVYLEPKDMYKWLREYEPVAKIGYSIFIYDLNNHTPDMRKAP